MGAEKTRREAGFRRDAAAVREPRTREAPVGVRQKTQPNIAIAIKAKTPREAATDFFGCGRMNTWLAPGCGGGDDTPNVASTSTCVSSFSPASVSIRETTQRASWRLLISSASVSLRPFFVRRLIA